MSLIFFCIELFYYIYYNVKFNRERGFEESLYEDDKDEEEEEEKPTKNPIASSSPRSKSPASRRSKTPVRAQSSQSGKSRGRQSTRETSWTKYPEKTETPSKPPPKQETKEEEPPKKEPSKQPIEEEKEESSDTSDSVLYSSDRNIHREGYDRPLSRLGHIPEGKLSTSSFMLNQGSGPSNLWFYDALFCLFLLYWKQI